MAKLTLPDIGTLANTTSAREAINDNFTAIETALENTLSRDGTTPNNMEADLDMDGNTILNVADPVSDTDAVNLRSVEPLVEQFVSEIAELLIEGTSRSEKFVATAGQTEFILEGEPGSVLNTHVFKNGLALIPNEDFTVEDAVMTLLSAAALNDEILVRYVDVAPADSLLRADLESASTTKGGSLIAYQADETGGALIDLRTKAKETVSDVEFGAVGDGTTDDTDALSNACDAAVARGRKLVLDGSKSYGITLQLSLPAGLRMDTNGATFVDLAGTTSNTPLIVCPASAEVDEINISIPTGLRRDRAISVTGSTPPKVRRISVVSVDQQATAENDDAAIRIAATGSVDFDHLKVVNYDRAALSDSADVLHIRTLEIESYMRGLLVEDCTSLRIDGGSITTASPNASYTAGHVGILVSGNSEDSSRNITLSDLVIEDAGEHGIRIGGPEQQSNITINRGRIKNCGGSGIKILGTDSGTPTTRNKRVQLNDCIIEDCGSGGITSNMCGILVMYADDVYINNVIVRKEEKLQCGYAGVRLVACGDIHITEPEISDATFDGIWIDGSLGDIDRVSISGGMSRNNGRDGLRVTAGTSTFRRFNVDGIALDGNTGIGLNIAIGGGSLTQSIFRAKVHSNTGGSVACDSTAAMLHITGEQHATTPLSGITCANGSTWNDYTLTYTYLGNDWIGRGRVKLGSAVTNNNAVANTIQDVTGLSFPVVSGRTYRFKFVAQYSAAAATTGSRWSVNGPTTTFLQYRSEYSLSTTSRTVNDGLGGAYDAPAACNTDSPSTAARNLAIVEGTVIPSADGTMTMRFASEVAGSAITASANSYCEYEVVI